MKEDIDFLELKFCFDGKPLPEYDSGEPVPVIGMSLRDSGSMRFRWDEVNENRSRFVSELTAGKFGRPVAVELIHSKDVRVAENADSLQDVKADGIISDNRDLFLAVTVADCMPIYFYDRKNKVFGVLHSGWKGTGIVENAVKLAGERFGSEPENICIVMGPHIHGCCYTVKEARAKYFTENFTGKSINYLGEGKYSLSLAEANLAALDRAGIPRGNVYVSDECTCCNEKFGSFRRETMNLPSDMYLQERMKHFTVQMAYCYYA